MGLADWLESTMQNATCHYCPAEATTRDHIVSRKKFRTLPTGREHPFFVLNIVTACGDCNSRKGHRRSSCECERCAQVWLMYHRLRSGVEPSKVA